MRVLPIALVLVVTLLMAGCPKKPTTAPDEGTGSEVPGQAEGATTGGAGAEGVGEARPLPGAEVSEEEAAAAARAARTIYFDFDSSEIRPEYASVIASHARRLASNVTLTVRLEGHTDERGSREYNIALGERRAQAVRRALLLQGAGENQVATVSYGEERPAVDGMTEEAWAENRRVEIVDAN